MNQPPTTDPAHRIAELEAENRRIMEHNMQLLLLLKEKESRLQHAEAVIRKYRSRLIRWFEDMQADPMADPSAEAPPRA
jgi:hypothetical protein